MPCRDTCVHYTEGLCFACHGDEGACESVEEAYMDWIDWLAGLKDVAASEGWQLVGEDEDYRANWEAGQSAEDVIEDEESEYDLEPGDDEADIDPDDLDDWDESGDSLEEEDE